MLLKKSFKPESKITMDERLHLLVQRFEKIKISEASKGKTRAKTSMGRSRLNNRINTTISRANTFAMNHPLNPNDPKTKLRAKSKGLNRGQRAYHKNKGVPSSGNGLMKARGKGEKQASIKTK